MSQPPMPPGPPTEPLPQPQFQTWPLLGTPPPEQRPRRRAAPTRPCPSSAAAEEPKRFGWPTVIVTAVVALSLGGMLFAFGGEPTPTAVPEAKATVTETETADEIAQPKDPAPKTKEQDHRRSPPTRSAMAFTTWALMSKLESTRPTCPKASCATGSAAGGRHQRLDLGVPRRPRSPIGNAQERRDFRDRGLRHVEEGLISAPVGNSPRWYP